MTRPSYSADPPPQTPRSLKTPQIQTTFSHCRNFKITAVSQFNCTSSDESHLPSPSLSHNVLSADISLVKGDIYHIIVNKYLLVVAASGGALCPEVIVILCFHHSCGRQVHTPCSSFLLRKVRQEPLWPAHCSKL